MTFDITETSTGAVFAVTESPEKGDAEGVDEVSYDYCLRNMADYRVSRSIDYWS